MFPLWIATSFGCIQTAHSTELFLLVTALLALIKPIFLEEYIAVYVGVVESRAYWMKTCLRVDGQQIGQSHEILQQRGKLFSRVSTNPWCIRWNHNITLLSLLEASPSHQIIYWNETQYSDMNQTSVFKINVIQKFFIPICCVKTSHFFDMIFPVIVRNWAEQRTDVFRCVCADVGEDISVTLTRKHVEVFFYNVRKSTNREVLFWMHDVPSTSQIQRLKCVKAIVHILHVR